MMKRFRVFDIENQSLVGKFNTISEVYACLFNLSESGGDYFVDDITGDIEVSAEDFLLAYQHGEKFEDLTIFKK
jgi:hypothetical protein